MWGFVRSNLKLAMIEAVKMERDLEVSDPGQLLEEVKAMSAGLIKGRAITLHYQRPEGEIRVMGDPDRLRQVFTNLAGNALKFTERGQIIVAVREETRHGVSTTLHFSVADTGIGIAKEGQAAVFEAFSQADGTPTPQFGGAGRGHALSTTLAGPPG